MIGKNRIYQPVLYQGPPLENRRRHYFEGWYYKMTSPEGGRLALIPGISLNREESHGFIQILDGTTGDSSYCPFPLEEVRFSSRPFSVSLGRNRFSLEEIILGDRTPLEGSVRISSLRPYGATLARPGIMGWYRYLPAMECYHGLVSTGHDVAGRFRGSLDSSPEREWDFSRSRGYIEKDWGSSFPSSYIWMQANSFTGRNHSFMLSIARIPWLGSHFTGFLGYLDLGEERLTFATYTGSRLFLNEEREKVTVLIKGGSPLSRDSLGRKGVLSINCLGKGGGKLVAPTTKKMGRNIGESLDARIELELCRPGRAPLRLSSGQAGFERVGRKGDLGTL